MTDINVPNLAFGIVTYTIWALWIICCTLGSLWTLDLIEYGNEDCIEPFDLTKPIPISLIIFSDFNGLILLISLVILFMQEQSVYKILFSSAIIISFIQIGLNITLFIYVDNIHYTTIDSNDSDCEFDKDVIHTSYAAYYCLIIGLIIVVILALLACIFALIMLYCHDVSISDYIIEGDDTETRLIQRGKSTAIRQTDFDEKDAEESMSYSKKPFGGKLKWKDYISTFDKEELEQMIETNEYEPLRTEMYFLLIEIKALRPTQNPLIGRKETLKGNNVPFKVKLNNNNEINGYAIYNKRRNIINGVCRILLVSKKELNNLQQISYTIGNETLQSISINNSQNIITINNSTEKWKRNNKISKDNNDIIESKLCKFKSLNIHLYLEKLTIYYSMRFPTKEQCNVYSTYESSDDECKEIQFENGANDMPILFENERNMQIYYNKHNNIVYGIYNDTSDMCYTHCGFNITHSKNKHSVWFDGYEYLPYYYQNITQPFYMCCRYNFIKDICLRGQDNEFNIFRSLCFLSDKTIERNQQIWERLSISVLVVICQSMLTTGVVLEVIKEWNLSEMFDDDRIIITISFLVFALISYSYWFTVVKFYRFYECLYYIAKIDWIIFILDFASNIIIGIIIVIFAFNYLLLSEGIADVVLNSFALTFIIELDDIVNLFESDEEYLLLQDWNNCVIRPISKDFIPWDNDENNSFSKDWDEQLLKRNINLNVSKVIWKVVVSVILSPLFLFWAIWKLFQGVYHQIKIRNNQLNWTKNTKDKLS